jgi:hypothetical protein
VLGPDLDRTKDEEPRTEDSRYIDLKSALEHAFIDIGKGVGLDLPRSRWGYDERAMGDGASVRRCPQLRLSDRSGPVIAVVTSAMSTIMAKISGVRMPRS